MNTFTTQKFKTACLKTAGGLILLLLMVFTINTNAQCSGSTASYCTPTATSGPASYNMGIANVTYGSINNTTASGAGIYFDYTNLSTAVTAGTSQSISIGLQTGYAQHCLVWIDWNNDGTFSTGAETVLSYNNSGGSMTPNPVTGTVTCPTGTSSGAKRMRVQSEYYGQTFPAAYNGCTGYYSEFEDYTVVVATSGVNIAAVALTAPSTWSVGSNSISLKYQNVGIPSISSASFGYSCTNGGNTLNSSVTLASSITTGQTGVYTFGVPLTIASGSYTLKVWANNPNNTQPDAFACNDTITLTVCTGLSGSFTINPSGSGSSNFTTFGAAVTALSGCGISGPVTFTVSPGTYNEQFILPSIAGASATNTITFDGVDSATRILSYSASSAVVELNGAKYVTIKNLTISNTYTTTSGVSYYGIHIKNSANFNKIQKCKIATITAGQPFYYSVPLGICGTNYYDGGDNGNNNLIDGNRLIGGYIGMAIMGNSSIVPAMCAGNIISNNRLDDAYQYGIYVNYESNFKIDHNIINMASNMTNSYGLYVYYVGTTDITRNEVYSSAYGVLFYTYSFYNPTGVCNINNNVIAAQNQGTSYYGLYLNNANNTNVIHNTVYHNKASGYALYDYISYPGNRINNNIFMVTVSTAYAMYVGNVSTGYYTSFDYNTLSAPANTANLAYFAPNTYATIAALKAGNTSFNQNNNDVLPVFASSTNFHLSTNIEQARGMAGTGVTIDIDGDARCVFAPSIGADESGFVTAPPTAGFTAGTIYINSPFTLLNNYPSSLPMSHKWYINGVLVATTTNLTYTFTSLGTFCIGLRSTNCSGTDSINTCITVVNPGIPPLSDFISNVSVVNTYQNVSFTDLSSNGPSSWLWSVSPGTVNVDFFYTSGTSATSQNPVIYWATSGNYSICLKASNLVGSGSNRCKTSYIIVQAAQSMCIFPFSTKVSVGNLYSSSGPTGGYQQNENCTFTIDACADSTFLNVTKASYGSGTIDRFEIYEGDYFAGAIPKVTFSGNGTIVPVLIGVKGKMTVREVTDATLNNGTGIVANWYTTAGTFAPPSGTIVGSNNAYYCGSGIYNYYSSSFRDPSYQYDWDFDQDGTTDFTGMDGYYSFSSLGVDTIKLKISGCGGNITLTKVINIINPPVPTANFNTTMFTATSVDTVQLNDLSTGGVLTWKWTVTGPGNVNYVGGTSNTSRNPKIMAAVAGTYTVKLVVTNCSGSDSITFSNYFKILSYCIPTAGNLLPDLTITTFQMGSINNTVTIPQPGQVAYRDYSQSASTNVDRGATYPFTVIRTSNYNSAGIKIWVDWNQDGIFDPVSELAGSTVTGNISWTSTLFTPKSATLGATRLRIGVAYNNLNNTPCGANIYGEYQDFRVVVRPDVTPPVLTLGGPNPARVEIGRNFIESGDVATDAVDGVVTDSIAYSGYIGGRGYQLPITKQATALGTFTVTASASDLSGNITVKTRSVIVTPDTTKPVITLNGANPLFVEVFTPYTDPGAVAADFFFTSIITVNSTNNVNTSVLGSYIATYTATDANGNSAIPVIRTIIVRDSQAPVIVFPANTDTVYVEVRSNYTDAGATVTDNYYTGLTATLSGSVNTYVPGTYYYTFNAKDGSGNSATPRVRVIIVRDNTAPELVLASPSDPDTLVLEVKAYTIVPEPGFVATDNYYPASQITVSKSGIVDLNKIGIYVVTYTATDPVGNSSAAKRRIYKLVDSTKPVITLNGANSVNICRWRPYTDLGAVVNDNYWNGLQVVVSSNVDMNLPGIYLVSYNAMDSSGNIANTVIRYVNVLDNNSSSCATFNGINGNLNNNNITVVPNPTNGLITIDITLASEQKSEIIIYNSLGQIIRVVDNASILSASYSVDLQNEASGIYFVSVKSGVNSFAKKFVLNK